MKEKIIFYLKLLLLVCPAIMGYLFVYLFIWFLSGLPMEWWATAILAALAGLSEYATIRLIGRTDNGVTVQEWIPISEPPKEKGRYWCNVKSFSFPGKYYQTVLKWDDGFIEGSIYTDDVTHWMPLPEPPEVEK